MAPLGAPPAGAGRNVAILSVIVLALGILGGAGYYAYRHYMPGKAKPDVTADAGMSQPAPAATPPCRSAGNSAGVPSCRSTARAAAHAADRRAGSGLYAARPQRPPGHATTPTPSALAPALPPPSRRRPRLRRRCPTRHPPNLSQPRRLLPRNRTVLRLKPETPPPARPEPVRPAPPVQPPARPAHAPLHLCPARPAYNGPTRGVLVWTGQLDKEGSVTIDGGTASAGSLQGVLPGVPISIEVDAKDIGMTESPRASNGWKKLTLRSHKKRNGPITIRWKVVN